MSGRACAACRAVDSAIADGKTITDRSARAAYRERNDSKKPDAAVGPRFTFQFAARMGLRSEAILLVRQCGETRQRLALEELERCSAAGGHVAHLLGESRLLHRRGRIAAAHDRRRAL